MLVEVGRDIDGVFPMFLWSGVGVSMVEVNSDVTPKDLEKALDEETIGSCGGVFWKLR